MPSAPSRLRGPRARGGRRAGGKGSIAAALRELDRQARIELSALQDEFVVAARELQKEIVDDTSSQTHLPRGQAKRRVRVYKSRKGNPKMFVKVVLGESSSKIHTGRIKGVRQRKGKVHSVPGVDLRGPAFLLSPNRFRGQKRRIYQRTPKGIEAVTHPTRILVIFEGRADRRTEALLAGAYRRAIAKAHRTRFSRAGRAVLGGEVRV